MSVLYLFSYATPASFKKLVIVLQEIEASEVEDANTELMPLGSLQKGSIDIVGATVSTNPNYHRPHHVDGLELIIRIENQDKPPFEVKILALRERVHSTMVSILASGPSCPGFDSRNFQCC